jgi:acetyl/propionyl-CoA carboxylase alpha subunit/acetyl-CoA carboxylase carboxyltransferase component
VTSILIANRGEIAIRIAQAAAELGLETVAVHASDEADALHLAAAGAVVGLPGQGAAAYLDGAAIIEAALAQGCQAIHPGYGFLSERADFAEAVTKAGLIFVGPGTETLAVLGNKTEAIALARSLGVPVVAGLGTDATDADIAVFLNDNPGGVMLKAAGGGGGRGMRVVRDAATLADVLPTLRSEADAAFGDPRLYVERLMTGARHIEVQVLGDGKNIVHLWERDCSLQRRHQKVIEIAPAPGLDPGLRAQLLDHALKLAGAVGLKGLATFEFLVEPGGGVAFIEANPRLQVEHTITEEITGIDLVQAQIKVAFGATLPKLGLIQSAIPAPNGTAIQLRISCERLTDDGHAMPTGGEIATYTPPGGPGVRLDGSGYVGFRPHPGFDSLLAKLIVRAANVDQAIARARQALERFQIEGVETNKPVLTALLGWPELTSGLTTTEMMDARLAELVACQPAPRARTGHANQITAPMQGTIRDVHVAEGEDVAAGQRVFTLEAMKMQHAITAPADGRIGEISVQQGQTVSEGAALAGFDPLAAGSAAIVAAPPPDPDHIRPDLQELETRRALLADAARPEAMARRHKGGKRSARENLADLCDAGSFREYGDFAFAAQRARRSVDDLVKNTPADGMISGFGTINADQFGPDRSRCAVMAYDYTVLAGTQGVMNHTKKDRLFDLAYRQRTPIVLYCEGGGGRPGDVDAMATTIAGLHLTTFWHQARLSGLVPMVGIGSGRVFAGNAALLGCCDVVIATRDATIGMGGPAMIEGGGLGVFKPEEVGPSDVQSANGVIDILVEDETEATEAAKRYLGYFQGRTTGWTAPDTRQLRHVVPENRLEVYDVHAALDSLADLDSVLELRRDFAPGMVTALARIEGRPVGIIANNPVVLAGAIDSPAADKAARFIRLCDAFDIPIVSLIDTPGMMVGPDVEKTALVRHCSRLFLTAGNVTVPFMSVVLRKGYGLGAMAMAGGSFHTPVFTVSWPSGEFGGMGLEGAVRLGYRKELEAETDPAKRQALFERHLATYYERGKALSAASVLEIDTVIDPSETRAWISASLDAAPPPEPRSGKKHAFVDAW